jgi:hypothetical protein
MKTSEKKYTYGETEKDEFDDILRGFEEEEEKNNNHDFKNNLTDIDTR